METSDEKGLKTFERLKEDMEEDIETEDDEDDEDEEMDNASLFRMWDSMRIALEEEANIDGTILPPPSSSSSSSSSSATPLSKRPVGVGLSKSVGVPTRDLVNLEDQLLTMWSESRPPRSGQGSEGGTSILGLEEIEDEDEDSFKAEVSDMFEQVMAVESLIQSELLPSDHSVPIERISEYQSAAIEELTAVGTPSAAVTDRTHRPLLLPHRPPRRPLPLRRVCCLFLPFLLSTQTPSSRSWRKSF